MRRYELSVICQSEDRDRTTESQNVRFCSRNLARPAGLEPATFGSGGQRSIQLSYGRVRRYAFAKLAWAKLTPLRPNVSEGWRARRDLNPRPTGSKPGALSN